MKKIDTKGFVMVETIIVAVFVMGVCTFLFSNFLPLIGDYERISKYDTVTSKYKVNEIRKMVLRDINLRNDLRPMFFEISSSKNYMRFITTSRTVDGMEIFTNGLCSQLTSKNYCNMLFSPNYLDVKEIIITTFKLDALKEQIKELSGERALKEYINYLPTYSNYSTKYNDYYRLIVVFNNGEMANIEVSYEA